MLSVNGTAVTGTLIGGPTTFFSNIQGSAYRADITGLNAVIDGMNSLSISDLAACDSINNGAGVLVIFDDGSSPEAGIEVRDGADLAFVNFSPPLDTTVPQTFTFDASAFDRVADLVMFFGSVADDRFRPSAVDITVSPGGVTTELVNLLGSNDGSEHDTVVISVAVPAGATMITVQAFSEDRESTGALPASFIWNTAGVAVRGEEPPGLDGRITGGGSNITVDGLRITKGLQLHCDLRNPNNFQINWPGAAFHLEALTVANCTEDPDIIQQPPMSSPFDTFQAEGTGRLRINGERDENATVRFILVDAGEPGTADTARIVIRDGDGNIVLDLPETVLTHGNFQTHKD
ncbi:hypothetical protein DRB17_11685 [Ferruginivarius sediminum]|uniref:Uncharacterized protein n=2 Tax=Ferruginivarius sediminum TaxID=2661937 RepID=A0A369T8G4_9PROT|nr:hypothetical protein DRB17_11685 [Ferruginivarius sediminum]